MATISEAMAWSDEGKAHVHDLLAGRSDVSFPDNYKEPGEKKRWFARGRIEEMDRLKSEGSP